MLAVLGSFLAVWGIGWIIGAPVRLRLFIIAAIWGLVVLTLLALPEGPLRQGLGGDVRPWLVLGGAAALALAYRALLTRLRQRASGAATPTAPGSFRAAELNRYSRHILLREIGGPGQKRLKQARVLVIGAGGLGSPICLYLAAAGVGHLTVVDDDRVDTSNLQRQIIHRDADLDRPKAQSAAAAMRALNPFITVEPLVARLEGDLAERLIASHDLILDGTDNFDTRYLVNRLAARLGKPLIAGAITQWEGQVSLYHPASGAPCFQCVFPERPAPGMVPTCAEAGVAAPLPGVIGSIMAMEAVKQLTGAGETLRGRLMIHDALYAETRVIAVKPRPDCPVCGAAAKVAPGAEV